MSVLPPKPSLEQLRKRAKERARADSVKLSEAQFRIAREHGFPSWPKLQAYVRRVTEHGPGLQHAYHHDTGYYSGRATGLLASAEDGTPAARAQFERWALPLTRDGARAVVAREHGFGSWRALREHVTSLTDSGEPFARAYDLVEARDPDGLAALLDVFPDLVRASGTNGNDLLGMACAKNDERLVHVLLERGADLAHQNVHGWTALHQTAYANRPALIRLLIEAGAPLDVSGRGDGGTPLVVALFWGHREAAEALSAYRTAPGNLRVAAGLGDRDLLTALVAPDGTLAPEAGAHREFYRPHSGFTAWRYSDSPAEIRDEALCWAARNNRVEALEFLVSRGADLDADVYRGTALTWAAAEGKLDAVRALLRLGADVNRAGTFGGPKHGEGVTALHLAAQNDRVEVIDVLASAGADLQARDALFSSTPEGWAQVCGAPAAHRRLRALAGA